MKKYNVFITSNAIEDIEDVFNYIALTFKAPLTAKRFRDGLYREIIGLSVYAGAISVSHNKSIQDLYGLGARRINYKKLAIIYIIDGNDVFVERIIRAEAIKEL